MLSGLICLLTPAGTNNPMSLSLIQGQSYFLSSLSFDETEAGQDSSGNPVFYIKAITYWKFYTSHHQVSKPIAVHLILPVKSVVSH